MAASTQENYFRRFVRILGGFILSLTGLTRVSLTLATKLVFITAPVILVRRTLRTGEGGVFALPTLEVVGFLPEETLRATRWSRSARD